MMTTIAKMKSSMISRGVGVDGVDGVHDDGDDGENEVLYDLSRRWRQWRRRRWVIVFRDASQGVLECVPGCFGMTHMGHPKT